MRVARHHEKILNCGGRFLQRVAFERSGLCDLVDGLLDVQMMASQNDLLTFGSEGQKLYKLAALPATQSTKPKTNFWLTVTVQILRLTQDPLCSRGGMRLPHTR